MQRSTWSLRWLIGGIYFFIVVIILGPLALYALRRTESESMAMITGFLRSNAMVSAEIVGRLLENMEKEDRVWQAMRQRTQDNYLVHLIDRTNTPNSATNDDLSKRRQLDEAIRSIFLKTQLETSGGGLQLSTQVRYVVLLGPDGRVLLTTNAAVENILPVKPSSLDELTPEVREARSVLGVGQDIRTDPTTGENFLLVAVPVKVRPPHRSAPHTSSQMPRTKVVRGILLLAKPLTEVQEAIHRTNIAIGWAFIGAIAVLFFIVAGISSFVTKPLATLSHAAERFAAGEFNERVTPAGAAEIASLGESFNRMVSELRQTITTLTQERAQAEAILASMVDSVLVTDMEGKIILMNRSAERVCGKEERAVIGKTLTEAVLHFDLEDLLKKTIASRTPLQHEISLYQPTERVYEVHMAPVDARGRLLGVVIVLYDITNLRRLEQVRRDFVANVSHELRTPITSVRAMAETLLDAGMEDPEMANEFLKTITMESERLTALLDDLLQLSHVESGRRLLSLEELDVCDLLRHVAERVMTPITRKGQRLILELPDELTMLADRSALVQVIINLLDNARKYSPEGATITVRAEAGNPVRISVQDTGYGIPRNEKDRIFERFYRVDRARSRAEGGTGLGLSIVKHLVELHGGTIAVQSDTGEGSTFTASFPQTAMSTGIAEDAGEHSSGSTGTVAHQDTAATG
jgi:two-component system phosphate regulon sensor histidine kinase PhoR